MEEIFKYIDEHKKDYIEALREAVAIKSVSAWPETRDDIVKMVHWVAKYLEKEGARITLADPGKQTLPNGITIPLPPILLGTLGEDPNKKTICVYGHLDVQPASKDDGWDTEPFVLTEKSGKLYGRGATDDKGPVLAWLHAITAFRKTGKELPVNLKFCFEGMEESGSEGLDDLIFSEKDKFLKNVDYVCISDNYWLGKNKPCLTYGLRGVCYFYIEVTCACKDLHSGVMGGSVHEAMADLIALMNSLTDARGNILVQGIMNDVVPVTSDEEKLYENIDFDLEVYRKDIGCEKLVRTDKKKTLMRRWRYPSLSLHGIEGAFSGAGCKTVIPSKVTGKFSIRIVPHQEPRKIEEMVVAHLKKVHQSRNSPNKLNAFLVHAGKAWISDPNHPNFVAGKKAIKQVYNVEPDLIREGGSIPVTLTFEEATGKNVLLLGIGASDDGAHSQNEKIDISNYIEGTKVLAAYMHEISQLK
ncbi:cytosolic non-specific dipeptidase [Nephila pilipes]|uniref:Cytosolic non-specific dipeptidase n=1 Tax=Nephila pilipes TaxID=299642 RepID=A0A8X6NU45_NEPPI|nr:cytosolic non-specific dipeptidase [Nephila pilipes]